MSEQFYTFDEGGDREVAGDVQSPVEEREEITLRPQKLDEFVGQHHIKEPLGISIEAAKSREESLEHVLLYGNPGLGKTSLAHIIAKEMDKQITVTSGPAMERVGDLAAILTNVQAGDVLFIDEIHRMNKTIEEVLYSAMEDFALDIIVGKGPSARTLRMPLEPFTLIGATTRLNLLSNPLRDRFGHVYHLKFYDTDDMAKIVSRSASILGAEIHDDASTTIAHRSRRTPRIANRLLKRVRDYAEVKGDGILTTDIAHASLNMLDVDEKGLDAIDRRILKTILDSFNGGPVGLSTIAASIAEDMDTIETIYEPYLLQLGFLERTPRGRKITGKGIDHIS